MSEDVRQTFARPGLKKIRPYWHPYRTNAKERWLGREMLELVSTEFRDRSVEYYRYALEAGVITVNGKPAREDTVVRNGDRIENIVHRHEPPVTDRPVKIIHTDEGGEFIVIDKPGSIPVHATGRYFKNSLVEILREHHGIAKPYTVNRLDRLTSGLMIIALNSARARILCAQFVERDIRKEYIARCRGCFPEGDLVVDQPMLTVDRQMGLNIVHPDGKPAKTIFNRLFYDAKTDSSVLHCRPVTGRSHQIRVHLQFLGFPVANDPVYSDRKVWVSIRAPCCRQWFDCAECHAEREDHKLARASEMVFACKNCKRTFRKDMSDYDENDEFCPHCDNRYVIEAKTPQAGPEFQAAAIVDSRMDNRMLSDDRTKTQQRTLEEDLEELLNA